MLMFISTFKSQKPAKPVCKVRPFHSFTQSSTTDCTMKYAENAVVSNTTDLVAVQRFSFIVHEKIYKNAFF